MLCPTCYGAGKQYLAIKPAPGLPLPAFVSPSSKPSLEITCGTCHGHGVVHCCEGEQSQPDAPEKE